MFHQSAKQIVTNATSHRHMFIARLRMNGHNGPGVLPAPRTCAGATLCS